MASTSAMLRDINLPNHESYVVVEQFMDQVLGYGSGTGIIFEAAGDGVEKHSTLFLSTMASLHYVLMGNNIKAKECLQTALLFKTDQTTSRELHHYHALDALLSGNSHSAKQHYSAIVTEYPEDLLAVKLHQTIDFGHGNSQGMKAIAEQSLRRIDTSLPSYHYLLGMLAFSKEQCGEIDEAERLARQAVSLAPNRQDPWAQHALAHVLDSTGRLDEGIQFMEQHSATWSRCNDFMYTHNWWHTALFYLDRDAADVSLKIYDQHVWTRDREFAECQMNSISLLWRLDLQRPYLPPLPGNEADVISRWEDVADHVSRATFECLDPFVALHYAMALSRTGREERLHDLFTHLEELSERHRTPPQPVGSDEAPSSAEITHAARWNQVALPVARAVAAYAGGRYDDALQHLGPAMTRLSTVGGSHAQRDVFVQTLTDIQQRCGCYGDARETLELKSATKGNTAWIQRRLVEVYNGLHEDGRKLEVEKTVEELVAHNGAENVLAKGKYSAP